MGITTGTGVDSANLTDESHFLTISQVTSLLPFGPRTLTRLVRAGRFPPPVFLPTAGGLRARPLWPASTVQAWIADLSANVEGGAQR